ncbi:lantibiotic immunity ABC transporter MutE/EpiE family permease subunit, partial [Paenibacillus sp. 28ISP30-2]|nr:lantibiotic immunity ABC transporter MutE/EpiE family permease subunit [Paenibacillus sp. 28ISP30-2]
IWILPFVNICYSFLISPMYFTSNTTNWWSILFLPLLISILCTLSDQKEKKASHYSTIWLLPLQPAKAWFTKIGIISIYSLFSLLFFLCMILIIGLLIPTFQTQLASSIGAILLLWVATLWEIPFCLFLAKRFGFAGTVILNCLSSLGIGITMATQSYWWISPWSWSIRMMCPVVGIHPNGLLLEANSPLRNASVLPVGIVMSVVLFMVLALITGKRFEKWGEH